MQVYKGRRKYTGQTVAMKFILKHGKSERDIVSLRQEIEILRGLKHENIIELKDFYESAEEFCLITEFAQGRETIFTGNIGPFAGPFTLLQRSNRLLWGILLAGELFEVLEDDERLPEAEVQGIAKQLVRALHYLHSNRIIHRDMKPQNVLIGGPCCILSGWTSLERPSHCSGVLRACMHAGDGDGSSNA